MIAITSRENFRNLLKRARQDGTDPAEVADRSGVLLTEQRLKDIQADVLGELADMLETTSAHNWTDTNRHIGPEDIRIGVASRLRRMEQATRLVGWRKG